ncbi:MAG: acyl carrier protein, partial [Oricola sp.]|nr:acyl carrier protein [Oricola sp.]
IKPETELASIEIESLDLAEIIFDLEDEFDVEIEMNTATAWDNLKTIQDIADSVTALIAKDK